MRRTSSLASPHAVLGLLAALGTTAVGVAHAAPQLVVQHIDDSRTISLDGNVRPETRLALDHGKVADGFTLRGMQMLLRRPVETQAALDHVVEGLTDRNAANYHRWLTAEELGRDYGPATDDVAMVVGWLQSHGFQVNGVQADRMIVDFSGTAGQVRNAFHTEIHDIDVKGARHIANMSNPRVPEALAPVISGVVSLHDFMPHTNFRRRAAYTFSSGGTTYQTLAPADLATIYNFGPLFSAGVSGKGQTIVVIEDTNVYSTADWTTFRSTFGLSGYSSGSFTQVHPTGKSSCSNPGTVSGAESEAELDAEWASAGAPNAAIELASCADTNTTFGGLIALENLIGGSSPPSIVSISYGECEVENGATANAAYNSTYESAAALGISVFVSAGDEGAASCDADATKATHGISVSGFASTPYNVAVGGTDYSDTYSGTNSTYWNTSNTANYGSAKSYIPEIPWNDSCASKLIATAEGYTATYGTSGFCNSSTGKEYFLTTASGSGGPSGCATGAASVSGVVSGTCKGYAKPSWQSLVGNPADSVRDLPDISLFAANGVWNHYYIFCDSDTRDGGAACTGAPSGWSGAGGTSFASPIMASIMALVVEEHGKQGNPNPTLYSLAKTEYGANGSSSCNSSNGVSVGASCLFYDTTLGDMDVNCTGTHSCYLPSSKNGVLSTSTSSYAPAYGTGTGWDFATGIGTVNATNLVQGW